MTTREFYLQRREAEFPVFMSVLKALPPDQLSYKPHERSPSAEQIVWTLARELKACIGAAREGKAEMENIPAPPLAEMLALYERWSKELIEVVSKIDDEGWDRSHQAVKRVMATTDAIEGPLAFVEKRTPQWTGR